MSVCVAHNRNRSRLRKLCGS